MYSTAAGQRWLIFSCSCRKFAGGSTMRFTSRVGASSASCSVNFGGRLSLGDERAVHVARADAQLQHDRRVRRLRQLEAALDHGDDAFQIRPRIEQPHLRLHRERVRALLHDRGAFAVVFADDHQRAAGDSAGRDVGERIRGDVGADSGFPGHGAADRIVDRSREHRRRGRLRGAGFEMDAELPAAAPAHRTARP